MFHDVAVELTYGNLASLSLNMSIVLLLCENKIL